MDTQAVPGPRLDEVRAFAVQTAGAAGRVLRERLNEPRDVAFKGQVDLVTDADRASEALIANAIRAAYPGHRLIGEEGSRAAHDDPDAHRPYGWIVDPLDGTTNYAHRYPHFAVSIALEHDGEVQVGVIYDPMRDEMFSAQRGRGAWLNGDPIRVSETAVISQALMATGFAYNLDERGEGTALWNRFNGACQGLRRDGAAALNIAWAACGRLDAYFERPVQPWDMAAALLLVTEAGGTISAFEQDDHDVYGHEIIASNGHLHAQTRKIILDSIGVSPSS